MAERVVDALERVDVEEQQPDSARRALERHERLSETVHQRRPVRQAGDRVMHLRRHVERDPERADDPPILIEQWQLGRRDPRVRTVVERLALDLRDYRLPGPNDPPLILERGSRMSFAEDVEIRAADHLLKRTPLPLSREPTRAHQYKAALEV